MDISDRELRSLLNMAFRAAKREGLSVADAEDVSSVAVLRLIETAEKVQHPVAWVLLVARRRAWALRRGRSVRDRFKEQQLVLLGEGLMSSDSFELGLDVEAALLSLEGLEKSALLWRYVEGKSLGAIAQSTGLSVETIKRRLKRGRQSLHRALSGRSVRSSRRFSQAQGNRALSIL